MRLAARLARAEGSELLQLSWRDLKEPALERASAAGTHAILELEPAQVAAAVA